MPERDLAVGRKTTSQVTGSPVRTRGSVRGSTRGKHATCAIIRERGNQGGVD
jgi:hypothetical protein